MKNFRITSWIVLSAGLMLFSLPAVSGQADSVVVIEHSETALGITPRAGDALCPSAPDLRTFSWEDAVANPPVSTGLGYAMMEDDLSGAVAIGESTYLIEPDTEIHGTLHLFYLPANSHSIDLRYMVILNEQQIAAFEDESSIYQDITLQPGEQSTIDLALPPLPPGIHDLIVLGLVEAELNNYGDVVSLFYRATLVVGDNPPLPKQEYQLLEPDAYKFGDEAFFNLTLHSDRSQHVWVWPKIYKSVQDTLDFYISVGYMESVVRLAEHDISPQPSPFAVLAFLDSEQIPIAPESSVFYGALTPNNLYSFIPVSLITSREEGRSDLLVLRVNYPGMPMCWLRGAREGYQFDSGGYATRVGVEFE